MIGAELGNFRVLDLLGEGGMGVVYKGVDTGLDRPVAIKVLNPEYSRNPELVERFRAEARAQANLNHTNIATLFAFLAQGGQAWMIMELIEGETFSQMLQRRGLLPPQVAVPLFKQALLGIGYAHRAGIIHRDIKPSNLMVNRHGIVKVMDFGIAKVMGSRGMTRTGTQMGTAYYMSPEQVMNTGVDIRSDIYSLGVTLFEMLTANLPFRGDSDFQIMSDHVHTPPAPPSRYYPYIPKGLENAVLKALEKHPGARFQTVEEFGVALEHADDFTYARAATTSSPGDTVVQRPTVGRPTRTPSGPATSNEPPAHTHTRLDPIQSPQQEAAPRRAGTGGMLGSMLSSTRSKLIAGAAALAVLLAIGLLSRSKPGPEIPPETPQQATNPPTSPTRPTQEITIPPPPAPADGPADSDLKIISFGADSKRVIPGQKTQLSWSVQGASQVAITPSVGAVKPEGNAEVSLQRTTEFTLIAKKLDGSIVRSKVVVEVAPQPGAPPTAPRRLEVSFEAYPNAVRSGQRALLRWSVPGATSVMITPGVGTVQPNGSMPVAPSQTTTYLLTARGPGGASSTGEVTINVEAPPSVPSPPSPPSPPPQIAPQAPLQQQAPPGIRPEITSFAAAPNSIQPGQAVTLHWSLRNAHSATISPEPGVLRQSAGQYRVSPATTTTYTLTARTQDGTTATATTTVEVSAPVPAANARPGRPMAVVHDHGGALNAYAWPSCSGVLQVVGSNLRYIVSRTSDGRSDPFEIPLSQIEEVKMNKMRIRNQVVFHITARGQHLNFVPVGVAAAQAVAEIEGAVGRR